MHQLQQPQLKMKPLLLPIPQLIKRPQHHLQKPRQLLLAEQRSRPPRAPLLIGRDLQQLRSRPIQPRAIRTNTHNLRNHTVPQIPYKLPSQLRRRVPRIQQLIRNRNHVGAAVPIHRLKNPFKHSIRNRPHQLTNLPHIQPRAAHPPPERWQSPGP